MWVKLIRTEPHFSSKNLQAHVTGLFSPRRPYLASITLSVSSFPHSQSFPGSTAKCRGSILYSESVRGITTVERDGKKIVRRTEPNQNQNSRSPSRTRHRQTPSIESHQDFTERLTTLWFVDVTLLFGAVPLLHGDQSREVCLVVRQHQGRAMALGSWHFQR